MSRQRITVILALLAAALAFWVARHDTWFVRFILILPLIRIAIDLPRDPKMRKKWASMALIATIAAALLHIGKARLVDGFIIPTELAITAWMLLGAFALIDTIDSLLLQRATRRITKPLLRSLARLALLLLVIPPVGAALVELVNAKTGYSVADMTPLPTPFRVTTADGLHIQGWYIDRGADATLIVAHGQGAHAGNFMPFLTTALADRHVNGLIFDFRGHGFSDGHTTSFGYHEQADLRAALQWLRDTHPRSARNLIFYAFSMGTGAALPVAADTHETLGVIIDSGFDHLTGVARSRAAILPHGPQEYLFYTGLASVSVVCEAPIWRVRPGDSLDAIRAPILVLHGEADAMIPASQAQQLLDHPGVTGRIIPGAQHTNLPAADVHYFDTVGKFLDTLLRMVEPPNARVPSTPQIGAPN